MKKRILTPVIVCLIAASSCISQINDAVLSLREHRREAIPVKVKTVDSTETISGTVYVGRVEPAKSATVLTRFPGIVENIYVNESRKVKAGQVLAAINSEDVKSAYSIARATLDQAEDGYARVEKVYESGGVTDVKMMEISTQLEKARAAEKAAKQSLEDCNVKCPFNGVIEKVFAHEGEKLTAAAPLVRILDTENVEIHFSVPENEYADLHTGDSAEVEIPALRKKVTATLAVKGVNASQLSHSYNFILKNISDNAALMPGMVCKIRMTSGSNVGIVIPASAVRTDMNGRYVWSVSADDTVSKTYIVICGYAGKGVIVGDGLQPGDRVITEGSRKVSTGMKVKAIEE